MPEQYITRTVGGATITELVVEPTPLTWANAPANYFWIDVGPFFDRIGAKRLQVLASADATVQAIVRDVQVRQYVDLKRADVPAALDLLIAAGVINSADKTALLNPVTTDYERHVKGLPQPVA